MKPSAIWFVSLATVTAFARPAPQTTPFAKQNGEDAINLNNQFAGLTPNSPCNDGDIACINQQFAQCVGGKFVLTKCASSLVCAALPLVESPGTTVACTTPADVTSRIAATGATNNSDSNGNGSGGNGNSGGTGNGGGSSVGPSPSSSSTAATPSSSGLNTGDPQTSLCLDPNLVQTGFEKDGQQTPEAGQVASATSSNNFINFCGTVNLPLTNGQQIKTGSCNAAPMGVIAATTNMPSAKFQFPPNLATIKANTPFTIKLAIKNLATGSFVNAQSNYYSAPQTVDPSGNIVGHSHLVVEQINGLTDTTVTNPENFVFFKGLNNAAQNGILSADVTGGLPPGTYRVASINSASNHQPVVVAVAQHGSLDDMVYFTVTNSGS